MVSLTSQSFRDFAVYNLQHLAYGNLDILIFNFIPTYV